MTIYDQSKSIVLSICDVTEWPIRSGAEIQYQLKNETRNRKIEWTLWILESYFSMEAPLKDFRISITSGSPSLHTISDKL